MPLASNQVQYSLLYRVPEVNGVADAVREAGATLVAYSPLAQGLLTGAWSPSCALPSVIEYSAKYRAPRPGALVFSGKSLCSAPCR